MKKELKILREVYKRIPKRLKNVPAMDRYKLFHFGQEAMNGYNEHNKEMKQIIRKMMKEVV